MFYIIFPHKQTFILIIDKIKNVRIAKKTMIFIFIILKTFIIKIAEAIETFITLTFFIMITLIQKRKRNKSRKDVILLI